MIEETYGITLVEGNTGTAVGGISFEPRCASPMLAQWLQNRWRRYGVVTAPRATRFAKNFSVMARAKKLSRLQQTFCCAILRLGMLAIATRPLRNLQTIGIAVVQPGRLSGWRHEAVSIAATFRVRVPFHSGL